MTPKERSKELVAAFYDHTMQHNFTESHGWELDHKVTTDRAKACAIICVDEILNYLIDSFVPNSAAIMAKDDKDICFYQSVKEEINNI